MNRSGSYLSFILTLIGAIGILCLDEKVVTDIFHQHEAVSFPTTTGRVYHSGVTVTHSSKGGTTYHINIFYEYLVNGQSYQGTKFRYGLLFSPSAAQAYAAVRAHPVGSDIEVYYRASDPADSLLSPGVVGRDFFMLFVLIPVTALLVQGLFTLDAPSWFQWRNQVAGGVKIISQGGQVRVQLPRYTVAAWTVGAFSVASLAALVTLAITTQRDPSTQPEAIAALGILAVTAVVYLWRRMRLLSGADDLVINEDARSILLPKTFGRWHPKTLDFNSIKAVCLEAVRHRSKGGYYYTWAVALELHDNAADTERLSHWSSRIRSEALAQWLRERLHLADPVVQIDAFSNAFSLSSSVG